VPADAAALRALQRHLAEPAPALLEAALSGVGELYVAVADAPVGYLLAVDGGPLADDGGLLTDDGGLLADDGGPLTGDVDIAAVDSDHVDRVVAGGVGAAPTVHVAELVVAPRARRRGHASALLATLLGEHPGATVTLTVAADNTAARSLYERFGFEVERTLPEYFGDGPGLLLVRRPRAE
jgi:ribosomal-protein-alanine N-acetyltransferase